MSRDRERILGLADKRLQFRVQELTLERNREASRTHAAMRSRQVSVRRFCQLKRKLISESRSVLCEKPEERLKRIALIKGKIGAQAGEIKRVDANIAQSRQLIADLAQQQLRVGRQKEKVGSILEAYGEQLADRVDQTLSEETAVLGFISARPDSAASSNMLTVTGEMRAVSAQEESSRNTRGEPQQNDPLLSEAPERSATRLAGEFEQPEIISDSTSVSFTCSDERERETAVTLTLNPEGDIEVDLQQHDAEAGAHHLNRAKQIRQTLEQHGLGVAHVKFEVAGNWGNA